MVSAVFNSGQKMGQSAKDLFGKFKDGLIDKLPEIVDWVKDIPQKIVNAIGNVGRLLWNVGGDIVDGLVGGIKDAFGWVEDTFNDLTSLIPDWKGPESVDRTLLAGPAKVIMTGFSTDLLEEASKTVRPALARIGADMTITAPSLSPLSTTAGNGPTASEIGGDVYMAEIHLGEGITQVVELKMRRQNRDLRRRATAGSGAAR